MFHDTLYGLFASNFPLKKRVIFSHNEPYIDDALIKLRRKRNREYNKHRRSQKYMQLESRYQGLLSKSKKRFFKRRIQPLKSTNPRQWYRALKRIAGYDSRDENPIVEDIKHLSDIEQAELIAESFAKISNEYAPLDRSMIQVQDIDKSCYLKTSAKEVADTISSLNANKSVPKNDIPTKVLKRFSGLICEPISELINDCIAEGVWPDFLKIESVTPVPKVAHPQSANDLRKIAGLPNLSKVMEKIIVKYLVEDMRTKLDACQFANQANQSINHYLIKLVDKVLSVLDGSTKGEHTAVIATLVDWSKAFDRQDPTLAIKSFQDNGVRSSLIPILMSFFENRLMFVKWHGVNSSTKSLPGGGPQGTSLGLWSFLSQTNDNPEDTDIENMYKFVDDKTTLEVINLMSIGIASHNPKVTVPSNVGTSNLIIPAENLKTQEHLNNISKWTGDKKMRLNIDKTKNIIFNFSKKSQFSTEIRLEDKVIETVSETKLLGTLITNNMSWKKNIEKIVKESNRRMSFLHKIAKFTSNKQDLKRIYILQVRSKLEQSAVVWHSSLTKECCDKLERVQKSALKVILGSSYTSYSDALNDLKLQSLAERRRSLCLKFAKKCLRTEKFNSMFPKKTKLHCMSKRYQEKFMVKDTWTERYKRSAIPYMVKLLNDEDRKRQGILNQIEKCLPVNNGSVCPLSLR